MTTAQQIDTFRAGLPEAKRADIDALHEFILGLLPGTRLWFEDGKDSTGKVVSNPNIGYGYQVLKYADGKTREFFQVGLSANATGVSVYILGIDDKAYLSQTYGDSIGKAKVTGYCIRFKRLEDINIDVLGQAIRYGVAASSPK